MLQGSSASRPLSMISDIAYRLISAAGAYRALAQGRASSAGVPLRASLRAFGTVDAIG
jgi:hypothetical protein